MDPERNPKTKSSVVSLLRHGHTLILDRNLSELSEMLEYEKYTASPIKGRIEMRYESGRLVTEGMVSMRLPAGMTQLVREELDRRGQPYRDLGRTADTQLRPIAALSANEVGGADQAFLDAIVSQHQGLVCVDQQHVSVEQLLLQVCLALPQARIVCATTRIQEVRRLGDALRQHMPQQVMTIDAGTRLPYTRRIVVGTYACLGGSEADLHNRDILFAVNAVEMLENDFGILTIRNADRSRLFGFLPTDSRLTQSQRQLVHAAFGPGKLAIPAHGIVERPVIALFLPFTHQHNDSGTGSVSNDLRTAIWRNQIRNRRIARLARVIATGDQAAIEQIVGNAAAASFLHTLYPTTQVAVLVENIEHALTMLRRFPGWQLIAGATLDLAGLCRKDADLLRSATTSEPGPGKCAIVTRAGLQDVPDLDVLVRADAGIGALPTYWAHAVCSSEQAKRPAIVVDFDDLRHTFFKKRSTERERSYLACGWRLPLQYPTHLDQYLGRRAK